LAEHSFFINFSIASLDLCAPSFSTTSPPAATSAASAALPCGASKKVEYLLQEASASIDPSKTRLIADNLGYGW
jgi:hypothetical protein